MAIDASRKLHDRDLIGMHEAPFIYIFFAVSLFLYAPLETFLRSGSDLWFDLMDVLPGIVSVTCLVATVLLLLSRVLREGIRAYYNILLFAIALLLPIQSNFLNVNYGVLDGTPFPWRDYSTLALTNTFIWVAFIFLLYCIQLTGSQKAWKLFARYISCTISCFLVGLIVLLSFQNVHHLVKQRNIMLKDGMLTLSSEENIVIFVIDTFNAETLVKLMDDPQIYDDLDGFTFYSDFVNSYPTTKGALPYILTGVYYENEQPYEEYIKTAYRETSMYRDLDELGYDIRLYVSDRFVSVDESAIKNSLMIDRYPSSRIGLLGKLYQYSFLRSVPHIFKQFFWFYSEEFNDYIRVSEDVGTAYDTTNLDFYTVVKEEGIALSGEKSMRFYHLRGMHPPFNQDVNLQISENATELTQAKGLFALLKNYMDQMKALDIYDSTTFVVMADHSSDYADLSLTRPLFLYKPKDSRGPMQVSELPASHADLIPTIMEDVLNSSEKYGPALNEITDMNRTRRLLQYGWDNSWNRDYLPPITEYTVLPQCWKPESFIATGNTY